MHRNRKEIAMKPVAIFRHAPTEGPGYFATALERRGIPWRIIKVDAGEPIPEQPAAYGGLAFMGGPMSVNDDLPWLPPTFQLIRNAVDQDIPVLGHCLGGQLMAKALGGTVSRNPVKEIGWGRVEVADHPEARRWFGPELKSFDAFHWHGEAFSLPPGATRILGNAFCANQAFSLGIHLGMQCHVEMTPDMVRDWCREGARSIARHLGPSVQSVEAIEANLNAKVAALNAVADGLYERWVAGLKR